MIDQRKLNTLEILEIVDWIKTISWETPKESYWQSTFRIDGKTIVLKVTPDLIEGWEQ